MKSFQNLPPGIAEKVALLKRHREQIKRLTEECARLEQELAPYNSSITSIHQCPPEILVDIFQFYLEENSRLIRRLMPVCKYWHSTLVQTPILWTHIPVKIDTREVDAKDVAISISPRIMTFLRHSGTLLLNVDIILEGLVTTQGFIQEQANHIKSRLSQRLNLDWWVQSKPNYRAIMNAAVNQPWHSSHILELLKLLTGERGNRMERWGTLKLWIPGNDPELSSFFDLFIGRTPHLTSLSIHSDKPLNTEEIFPVLSSLRRLEITNWALFEVLLQRNTLRRRQIEHLMVPCSRAREFGMLEDFTSLRTLMTHAYPYREGLQQQYFTTLRFPQLEEISFDGGGTHLEGITFQLPRLKHVRIERSRVDGFTELPDIEPKVVSWLIDDFYWSGWSFWDWKREITSLLTKYQLIEEIIIAQHVYEAFPVICEELRGCDALPTSLRFVHVTDDKNWGKVLRTYKVDESPLLVEISSGDGNYAAHSTALISWPMHNRTASS